MPARSPDRAADADRLQAALDLGPSRGGEHHPGRGQREQRQGDQQIDHDSGRLIEQHPDAGTGDEPQSAQAVAGRTGLDQYLVEVAGVAQPDLGHVDLGVGVAAEPGVDGGLGDVKARRGQRVADIVGGLGQADHALGAERADVDRVPYRYAPGSGQTGLDQHLTRPPREWPAGHHGIAGTAPADHLSRGLAVVAVGVDVDVGDLLAG